MAKITGLGGFFWKSADTAATAKWFTDVLDLPTKSWGRMFPWRDHDDPAKTGCTVMGLHSATSDYFGPSKREFMLNLIVDDLDGVLAGLRDKGVEVLKVIEGDAHGRFAHVAGPEGITIELWQPAPDEKEAP